MFTSLWHYVLMANYCWILMEGLYLHSLVFLAFFTDSSSILRYVTLGWGDMTAELLPLPLKMKRCGGSFIGSGRSGDVSPPDNAQFLGHATSSSRNPNAEELLNGTLLCPLDA
ncbi:hypothetical protein MTO96_048919 [Rhipicephalus appendiculatus]